MTMNVTFVTMFLRPTNSYRSIETYYSQFEKLASTRIPILIFLDTELSLPDYPNVSVIPIKRPSYRQDVILPDKRNVQKDTPDYFWIQLEKLRYLADARNYTTTPYLAWIDFGAYHMFKDIRLANFALRRIATSNYPTHTIFSPSCWKSQDYPIWETICWRFCGTFLLGYRDLFPKAFEKQQELVDKHMPNITWEVNYWTMMEEYFTTYHANHDESLLTELCHNICPDTSG